MYLLFTLLVVFQLKHFIADYLLQGEYMLGKFKDKKWVLPLASHCGVHFLFTILISLIATQSVKVSAFVGIIDFILHFLMDRIKASSKLLGRFKALSAKEFKALYQTEDGWGKNPNKEELKLIKSNKYFWWALGLDQMVHHLTDILIIFMLVTRNG